MTEELPPKWVETTLGELGKWHGGTTPRKSDPTYWADGTVPWVSPKDMKFDLIRDSEDRITERALADGVAALIPTGSLLVVMRSGILVHSAPVAVTVVPVAINQDIKALVPAEGVDARFVAEQLRARAPELLAHAVKAGTTVESLIFERLKTFPIRLAPRCEQTRIADRLAEARSLTAMAQEQAGLLTGAVADIKTSLADRVAHARLTTSGFRSRKPGERLKVSDLLVEPARTGLSVRGRLEPPGVKALRLSALRGSTVDLTDVRYLPTDEERTRKLALHSGDVLISRGSGTRAFVGRASLVRKVAEHVIFPDTSYRLRLDADRILPDWFVLVWNSPANRGTFEARIRTTAGIWKVAWRDLRNVELSVPDLDEQRDAVEAFRAASARLDLALEKRDRAMRFISRFEQTMVSRAFEGLLVPALEEQDAAALLDRIRVSPAATVKRRTRKADMPSTRDKFRALMSKAPEGGHSFDEIRRALPARYPELRDAVFEALADGTIRQHFDRNRGVMVLAKAS